MYTLIPFLALAITSSAAILPRGGASSTQWGEWVTVTASCETETVTATVTSVETDYMTVTSVSEVTDYVTDYNTVTLPAVTSYKKTTITLPAVTVTDYQTETETETETDYETTTAYVTDYVTDYKTITSTAPCSSTTWGAWNAPRA